MMLYISGFILLPFLLFLITLGFLKRKSFDTSHSLIFYFIILAFVSETLLRLCAWYFKNNIPLFNFLRLLEYIFLFGFYYKFLYSTFYKIFFRVAVVIFILIYLYEFFSKGLFAPYNYSFLFTNIIMVFLALTLFRNIISIPTTTFISDNSIFWINSAILVYYSCTLFIFGLKKYTVNFQVLSIVAIYLHLFFIFVFYSLLSIGLWKTSQKQIS